jgi:hypothetical protein
MAKRKKKNTRKDAQHHYSPGKLESKQDVSKAGGVRVGKDVKKQETSCTADGNGRWCSICGNQIEVPDMSK